MKAKHIITCAIALLLVIGLSSIALFSSNKAKAEYTQVDRLFTINAYNSMSINTLTATPHYLSDIDGNPFIFNFKLGVNDYTDDLDFIYFAIGLLKVSNSDYGVRIYSYNPNTLVLSSWNTLVFKYQGYGAYYLDYTSLFNDDWDYYEPYITALLNTGFYIVEGVSLPDSQLSKGYSQIEYNSLMYYAVKENYLFNIAYKSDSGYQTGYDTGYNEGYQSGLTNGYAYGEGAGYEEGYNYGYTYGLSQGNSATSEYTNVLRIAWNGATSFLSTKVFGNMTILHMILIPLTLGIFIIVIKIIRG